MITVPAITVLLVVVLAGVWLVEVRLKAGEKRQNSFAIAPLPPTQRVMIRLSGLDGKTESLLLEGERMTLGRSSANDFSYPADNALSRQHVAFEKNAGDWTIRDLASTNGTFVNGIRLVTVHVLRPGDRIVAGRLKMVCSSASEDAVNRRVLFDEEEQAATESSGAVGEAGHNRTSTWPSAPVPGVIIAGQRHKQFRPRINEVLRHLECNNSWPSSLKRSRGR